jgi:hypothetical protein
MNLYLAMAPNPQIEEIDSYNSSKFKKYAPKDDKKVKRQLIQ